MLQQVLVIHGGMTFASRQDYLLYLKNKTLELDDLRPHSGWRSKLQAQLGEKFDVLLPKMPNNQNASYEEWSILFSKMLPLLEVNAILIGHSLGGVFLAKYFSENKLSKKIKAVLLVAAPYESTAAETLADFNLVSSLASFSEQANSVHLFFSEDDPIVPIGELEKYKRALPKATVHRLSGYNHFIEEDFPEIISVLKSF